MAAKSASIQRGGTGVPPVRSRSTGSVPVSRTPIADSIVPPAPVPPLVTPPKLTPQQADDLLHDYTTWKSNYFALAKKHNLTVDQLVSWYHTVEVQTRLQRLTDMADHQARLTAKRHRSVALDRLAEIVAHHETPPLELRRAATQLLRSAAQIDPPAARAGATARPAPAEPCDRREPARAVPRAARARTARADRQRSPNTPPPTDPPSGRPGYPARTSLTHRPPPMHPPAAPPTACPTAGAPASRRSPRSTGPAPRSPRASPRGSRGPRTGRASPGRK